MGELKRRQDETDEQNAARVEESLERRKARQKAYYEANKGRIKSRQKEHNEANKERYKAYREANDELRGGLSFARQRHRNAPIKWC